MSADSNTSIDLSTRAFSGLIDIIFYTGIFLAVSFLYFNHIDINGQLPDSVSWIPISIYVLTFHAYLKQTPGMKIMGYKFVNAADGNKPAFWKMILRWVVAILLRFTALGLLIAILTFTSDSGFYWDRWFKIKAVRSNTPWF